MSDKPVSVGLDDLAPLKAAYKAAVCSRAELFTYRGAPILVAYCKYLIEYLEGVKKQTKGK